MPTSIIHEIFPRNETKTLIQLSNGFLAPLLLLPIHRTHEGRQNGVVSIFVPTRKIRDEAAAKDFLVKESSACKRTGAFTAKET